MEVPLLTISSFEQILYEPQETVILDLLSENIEQDLVIDAIEASLDVSLNEPFRSLACMANLRKRGVSPSLLPESVAGVLELRFEICL